MTKAGKNWVAASGQYLGEISALCFLQLPSHISSVPYLLAGTGSQVLLFDLSLGRALRSFCVFQGIRVHGISCHMVSLSPEDYSSCTVTFRIVVFGERRVKLFIMKFELPSRSEESTNPPIEMNLLQALPKFSHWVLDVSFLKVEKDSSGTSYSSLAVGCSDNSVHIWDIHTASIMLQVACPDKCLLYSMRLWGDEVEALRVASGTIFNEVVVWKVMHHQTPGSSRNENCLLNYQPFEGSIISRLSGHQGSIFRICWSTDGSKLVSVSDDRSARIWMAHGSSCGTEDAEDLDRCFTSGLVLYGHNARVWDCNISDSVVVTAGEDRTCRLSGLDGHELKTIREHIGRGIWRCLYDPQNCLLVTAGFDSAIKVHQCDSSLSWNSGNHDQEIFQENKVQKLCIPNSIGCAGFMDSRSEYVRCLQFASANALYVATNHGYVYHTQLSDSNSVEWNELAQVSDAQIICMDLFMTGLIKPCTSVEDWVAVGDGRGRVTVIKIVSECHTPKVDLLINWSAEKERQLLGVHWCTSLGHGYLFTSDPTGILKLWRILDPVQTSSESCIKKDNVYLVAEFKSSFRSRIMCLEVSIKEQVLICGDLRGNLLLFPLSESLFLGTSMQLEEKIPPLTYFKGAHGISVVSSISLLRSSAVEVCSTGGDGCICYFEYDRDQGILEFVGMKQVKELSLVQSILDNDSTPGSAASCYAVGFSSVDFVVWNSVTESKVVQIQCGGWRRPHSCYLGCIPEMNYCFAYVKDETIHVYRHWVKDVRKKTIPQHLHLQFHGREIHSLRFISAECEFEPGNQQNECSKSSYIATGCEDGTVRLTWCPPGNENWSTSKLLGEHVGGSAVRSLCFVSKVYLVGANITEPLNGTCCSNDALEKPLLLISAGAKHVLTSWLLRKKKNEDSFSFKWLSTDMPMKCVRNNKKLQDSGKLSTSLGSATCLDSDVNSMSGDLKNNGTERKLYMDDNDWRYLAVTAFLVKNTSSRFSVCFVIVASSDATLSLRALVLPCRYWFEVAQLAPLSSPVLALQHVIFSVHGLVEASSGYIQNKNIYIAISGSTDGCIAFWDLTKMVEDFMQRLSALQLENNVEFQKRPRTGRGSQGGRWWRSVNTDLSAKVPDSGSSTASDDSLLHGKSPEEDKNNNAQSCGEGRDVLLAPLYVLPNVHQSGVNCLSVSQCEDYYNNFVGHIISGGDDQAISSLKFTLLRAEGNDSHHIRLRILYQKKVASAHSSAVKGVWTDGRWVFSTGLDQRVRCWQLLDDQGELTEHSQVIISVPEPEALDATSQGRNCYLVGVAGRGMQVVTFSASDDTADATE